LGTIHRCLKAGVIKRKSSRLKPLLTDANKAERLRFCFGHFGGQGNEEGDVVFDDMDNTVHLDEKWFNADKDRRKFYVTEGEELPNRCCKSKRFIPKVMLLAAVTRPRFDSNGICTFDGKIGMWAFTEQAPAQRNSRNRPAGTLVTRCINVTAEIYHQFFLDKVIPAIKNKMPDNNKNVIFQHDNATPHGSITTGLLKGVSTDGWCCAVKPQPPNSPDLNVLDLGFFASIQSLQNKVTCRSIDDIVNASQQAFDQLSAETLDDVFHTLQSVMLLALEHHGGNRFKIPHKGKKRLRRRGELARNLLCPLALYYDVYHSVHSGFA
jgi:hypothetical protein